MTTKITTPKGVANYPHISKPDEGREYSDGNQCCITSWY